MKASPFNTTCKTRYGGKTIVYNTLSRSLVTLPEGIDGLDALPKDESLLSTLAELGFYTPDGTDQLDDLRSRFRKDASSTEALCMMVAPTMACNLACPYCYEREVRHPGMMDFQTQDALVRFIEQQRDSLGFKKLKIGWYGGEPLLGMDVIESLTHRFESLGMDYTATMTTNLSLCDGKMVERIIACDITSILTTIDGVGAEHDSRRPALDGHSTFETIAHAIVSLTSRGVAIRCICNLEEGNLSEVDKLRSHFGDNPLLDIAGTQAYDYCGLYGKVDDFNDSCYKLISDESMMAQMEYGRIKEMDLGPREYEALLSPIRLFCGRQLSTYCVIDEKGRIYECDGDIGYTDRAIGDIRGNGIPAHAPYDPTTDEYCSGCAFMPLCLGNCRWTRQHSDMRVCIPIRWVFDEILNDWIDKMDKPLRTSSGLEIYNEPAPLPFAGSYELWRD